MKGHHQRWPDIHLNELKEINPYTLGWIHMDKSPINYPVVQGFPDVRYNRVLNFSNELSYHGTIYMDPRHNGKFSPRTTIISGHHMKDRSMFYAVSLLQSQEIFEDHHRWLDLLLEDGLYRAEFFAVNLISFQDPEPVRVDFSSDEDYADWLSERKKQALFVIPVTPAITDRVLVLTTCYFPDDPDDRRDGVAAYAILRKAEAEAPVSM